MLKQAIVLSLLSTSVLADDVCGYKFNVNTNFEGVITSSKNNDKRTSDYVDDTRKCVVSMDIQIEDKWYPATGTYIFGPGMSENDACERAEISAKEEVLRKTVPEKLNKKMESSCGMAMAPKVIDVPLRPHHTIKFEPQNKQVKLQCRKKWYPIFIGGREVLAYKESCR